MARAARAVALGAALGVTLGAGRAGAQQQPPAPRPTPTRPTPPVESPGVDSAARADKDSVRGVPDSLRTPPVRRDSIQPPLTRAELPVGVTVGASYRFRGDTVLASGALTVLDLLERVPGLSGFRSGYLASIQTAAYNGDFRRVRLFRDGVELDPIDPRNGGVQDLVDLPLWQAEEVSVEPAAGEVRVHVRTRTVRNRTPQTRVDVATGDEETNLYRAYYGKRFGNGGLIQISAQQFGTGARNQRVGGGGDAVNPFVRLGWARRNLSVDALLTRLVRRRNVTLDALTQADVLPSLSARRDEGYLRVGLGDPEQGVWVQGIANVLRFRNESPDRLGTAADTVQADTSRYRTQYVLAGGVNRWGMRVSGTGRLRVYDGRTDLAPQFRWSYDRPWLSTWLVVERAGVDSSRRVDLSARVVPFRRLAVVGSTSQTRSTAAVGGGTRNVTRVEAATPLGGAWLSAGRVVRGAGTFAPPAAYTLGPTVETRLAAGAYTEPTVQGTVAALRGRVYRDVYADVNGVVWDEAGPYRPQYQGRAELRLLTNWLARFPSREFGANVAVFDEYRAEMSAPFVDRTTTTPTTSLLRAPSSNQLGALVEFRLQSAVISFQIRNALGRRFEYIPGVRAPGAVSIYGVRWEFSN